LATTELDKVPDTIISRCQTFTFKKPGREVIRKEIARIAKKEGYDLDSGAADLVALLGDGSFRDALGMLEKVIASSSDKKISREEVENITGAPRAGLVNSFIETLVAKNSDKALKCVGDAAKSGISMITFVTLILEKMRFILLVEHSASSKESVKERVSPDDWEFIESQAAKKLLTPAMLISMLEATDRIGRARIEQLPLEMAVVEVCEK
jgi:DNA polymerase-3 subunit gamma/tau